MRHEYVTEELRISTRVFATTFRGGLHFPFFARRVWIARFRPQGGLDSKMFGREAPENGAEGAVLENFRDFSEKLFLKNEIKSKNSGI